MIFSKDVTFPYPVLSNNSDSYLDSKFFLDIDLKENTFDYEFRILYELSSEYLMDLVEKRKAELVLVIKSKDNKFYTVRNNNHFVTVSKSRISLDKRTSLQLFIKAEEKLSFSGNNDLTSFYDDFKRDIFVDKHAVLGLSNVVIFDGSNKKPFEIFEKKLDPALNSDVSIELGSETIIIKYKSEELQFVSSPYSKSLNYPYIYMGLQKALIKMIVENGGDEESIIISEMDPPEGLNLKLYNLMKYKMVEELNFDNIDEVIYQISDRILEKFTSTIKGLSENGN